MIGADVLKIYCVIYNGMDLLYKAIAYKNYDDKLSNIYFTN